MRVTKGAAVIEVPQRPRRALEARACTTRYALMAGDESALNAERQHTSVCGVTNAFRQ